MKNWNKIGAVVVYSNSPNPKCYASLKDAIVSLNRGYSHYWERVPFIDQINKRGWMTHGDFYIEIGDRYLIRDDLGLLIPHWRIKYEYENLSDQELNDWRYWYRNKKNYKFRDGPVPGRGGWRGGSRAAKKLWQAVKADHYDNHDEDLKEYKFKRRNYDHRFAEFIDWDCYHGDWGIRNWKKYRKTQWKEKK